MKKIVILFWCVFLLFSVVPFCFAGGEEKEEAAVEAAKPEAAAEPGKKFKVGYSCISWTIPWMVYYKELFEKEITKYPNYEVIWHDAGFDFEVMADGLENFIAQDVDIILHFALDSLPMIETYKKIVDAGTPLILTMDPPDYKAYDYMTAFSGLDTRDAGRQCALLLHNELGGKGNIALITAPKGSSSELQYTAGFKNEMTRLNTGMKIVAEQPGDWDITVAQQAASDILTKYPNIDGFYVSDDWMGGGLVRALKEKGYKPGQVKIAVAGGSKIGVKDFKDGWYLGIADQGPVLCVYQDIFFMRALLEMGVQLPHFSMVRQELITWDNIDRFPGTW
jgi:ABC-type sugar transport system substrate-binding protein